VAGAAIGDIEVARHFSQLPDEAVRRVGVLWDQDGAERLTTLAKFQAILAVADREVLATGRAPYQSARLVVRLRNELIHYKPEMADLPGDPSSKPHWLAGLYAPNPFAHPRYGNLVDRYLSAGCARWALESVLALTEEVFARLGTKPTYLEMKPSAFDLLDAD